MLINDEELGLLLVDVTTSIVQKLVVVKLLDDNDSSIIKETKVFDAHLFLLSEVALVETIFAFFVTFVQKVA